ncbi:MAG: hypothetical protein K1X67_07845 [Fimbriimonadaceae bacterium]|nr:hypothetical protein [Fimbriimonadaceae bacterium]
MKQVKFTPGPWVASVVVSNRGNGIPAGTLCVTGNAQPGMGNEAGEGAICLVSPPEHVTDEDRANAFLIAAAPELFDALTRLVEVCESNSMLETVFESLATPMGVLAGAKAALVLATDEVTP